MASNAEFTSDEKIPCHIFSTFGKKLYLKDDCADFYFIFNSNDSECIKIAAHKILLTQSSSVFLTMFNGSWEENDEVEITDASVDAFKEFLQFFYLDAIQLSLENVAEVMYLGNKYNVQECVEICVKFLKNSLDEKNIIWGYHLAIKYEQKRLKDFCETIIGLLTKEVLVSDGFLHCDIDMLSHIVKLQRLNCSESDLFVALMQRIETIGGDDSVAKTTARNETKDLMVRYIRFGAMSIEEWSSLSLSYHDLFSPEEYREIVHVIGMKDFYAAKFNRIREKRNPSYSDRNLIVCDRLAPIFYSRQELYIKDVLNQSNCFVGTVHLSHVCRRR